ncbi:MAG TPA: helix-turn-helix transcriptional regulator [Geomonas sp.]|nr:helix-turn-helix transcriptional regulator [Geomonas sp.]
MENSAPISNKASAPGVLIIDGNNTLLHTNSEALSIIPTMKKCGEPDGELYLPEEIVSLCDQLKGSGKPGGTVHGRLSVCRDPYGMKAFFIHNPSGGDEPRSIMVLMEPLVEKRTLKLETAKDEFGLSRREFEVLQCICAGLSNREIAKKMFICEYTVKDHIKKIMNQLKLRSRNEIMAAFLSP